MDSAPSAFFDRLPKEIRDHIYSFAYADDACGEGSRPEFRIISLHRWMRDERSRRRYTKGAVARPIPTCPLLNMRLSRQFYHEAASSWFRARTFICDDPDELFEQCCSSSLMRDNILHLDLYWKRELISTYTISRSIFTRLESFRALRRLRLRVWEDIFDPIATKLSCVHQYEPDELRSLPSVQAILTTLCPRLRSIELCPLRSLYFTTPDEARQWERNVASLQEIIDADIAKKRPSRLVTHHEASSVSPTVHEHSMQGELPNVPSSVPASSKQPSVPPQATQDDLISTKRSTIDVGTQTAREQPPDMTKAIPQRVQESDSPPSGEESARPPNAHRPRSKWRAFFRR